MKSTAKESYCKIIPAIEQKNNIDRSIVQFVIHYSAI